jgi:hypothetical protein
VANTNDLSAWAAFNTDHGSHDIGLYMNCFTNSIIPCDLSISDSVEIDEYISDIENYRIFPSEYINMLYVRDNEGLYRTLYWLWTSASNPLNWFGKTAVNDFDITSWPEDAAPKLVYSPGNWAAGGGAVFSYLDRKGLYFDAPWNVTSANLLIITVDQFLAAIQPFVEWKKLTGIKTYVLDYKTLSDGRDSAERIKKAIDYYYKNYDVRYVLLFGDSEIIPTRYTLMAYQNGNLFPTEYLNKTSWGWSWCNGGAFDSRMLTFLPNYMASDLYYADLYDENGLFHTWDTNTNGYFAEMYKDHINPENIHAYPEIAVGRVPASNIQEVQNYVYKVKQYEQKTFHASWFNRAYLFANQDWSSWVDAAAKTADIMANAGFDVTHREHPSGGNADALINAATPNGMGFLLYDGHGAWGMGAYAHWHLCQEKLPVVFHAGCGAGEFTPNNLLFNGFTCAAGIQYNGYQHDNTPGYVNLPRDCSGLPPYPDPLQPVDKDGSYPEFLICQYPDRGAIVYYSANTGVQSPGEDHGTWFFEAFTKGHRFAGDMWKYAVTTYVREHDIHSIAPHRVTDGSSFPEPATIWDWVPPVRFHQTFKYTFFGDPTLRVGGIPEALASTSVPTLTQASVADFSLLGNYPNPFNSATMICFKVAKKGQTNLSIYNLNGQCVGQLVNQILNPGEYTFSWRPEQLASGIYFYRLKTDGTAATGRLLYLK